jgi:16S rRNA (guanine966-N2)-methyltransferase
VRIVGGRFKGRAIAGPKGDGGAARLRPSSDRLREAVFNLITHGDYPDLGGARVLDLFAGTGAMGLEALSRGAARVQFVDEGTEARALLRQNIETFDVIGQAKLYRRDATRLGEHRGEAFDFLLLDPPYHQGLGDKAILSALEGGWVAPGSIIVHETHAEETPAAEPRLSLLDERRYGMCKVTISSVIE